MSAARRSRRSFLGSLAGMGLARGGPPPRLYALQRFQAGSGPHSAWAQPAIFLEALAAPRMPQAAVLAPAAGPRPDAILLEAREIPRIAPRLFELRVYQTPVPDCLEIFHRNGIRPAFYSTTAYLIPFNSLVERAEAWDIFNAGRSPAAAFRRPIEISLWAPRQGTRL